MTAGLYNRWCILRMSGGSTVAVAEALTEAGYHVWTPVETQKRRVGRSRLVKESTLPITPGIVFARDDRLHDLLALSRSPALTYQVWNSEHKRMEKRGCPHFTVFRAVGQYPRIADRHLDPLRQAEQRSRPKGERMTFAPGDTVRHPGAGFDGLVGIVHENKRQYALVMFPGFTFAVKVLAANLLASRAA